MAANSSSISSSLQSRLSAPGGAPSVFSHGSSNLFKWSTGFLQFSEISKTRKGRRHPHRRSIQSISCYYHVENFATACDRLPAASAFDAAWKSIENMEAEQLLQALVLADLDPSTAKIAIGFVGPFLSAFGFLFIVRIVMSWYPKLPVGKFPYVIAYAPTEPFLKVTRKVIPPLGGVDVTPVVWFGLVSFLSEILVGPQGLLVLLSQQV
ncbi:protein COFACTOR ASSEMBLY OF COMPLEX C SUBUNIT B CCB3, chloroplastic [Aristolochia californica]|uniref:protein COFACTOR ASSEMBLY OF COMPLEX C SUBUNIT B CCB3, chloroplastic n=1 Tax=Aristolochia californica TaxID=171875 RepID=UPI0035DF2B8C